MSLTHPRLPNNSIAATLLVLSLILCGGGLMNWHKDWMFIANYRDLERTGRNPTNAFRPPRPEVIRRREKIALEQTVSSPVSIAASDKTPVISRIPTSEPVVFITIDDGITKNGDAADYMADRELPITAFLTLQAINNDYDYFGDLAKDGTSIQNHTVNHPNLPKHPYDSQKNEICSTSDTLEGKYGKRPKLFRPPYGEYNDDTLRAAAACGIKATIMWSVVVQNGALNYQREPGLKPGDIILMHYKPELKNDLEATVRSIREQGYKIGQLEDWVQ